MLDFVQRAAEIGGIAPELTPAALVVLKGSALLVAATLVARALKKQSAARRHLVWSAGIASALLLPLAQLSLPTWRVPVRYTSPVTQVAVVAPLQGEHAMDNASAVVQRTSANEPIAPMPRAEHAANENPAALRRYTPNPDPRLPRPGNSLGIPVQRLHKC